MAKKKIVEGKPMEDQPVDRNPHVVTELVLDMAGWRAFFELFNRPIEIYDLVRLEDIPDGKEYFCAGLAWGAVAKGGELHLAENLAVLPAFAKMDVEPGPEGYKVIRKAG